VIGHNPTPQLGTALVRDSEPPVERSVYFAGHGMVSCQVIRRTALPLDTYLDGPLIVEEPGSTTLVEPGMRLIRTQYDILLLELTMGEV
jgi:N-methylhydantoinase A/oxoprolinase/acetone carboxylase beta subunit